MAKKNNILVPEHTKLEESQISLVLKKYSVDDKLRLPKIKIKDPALEGLSLNAGDIVEITRHSFAGISKYYRVVIE